MSNVKSVSLKNLVVGQVVRIRTFGCKRDVEVLSVDYKHGPLPYNVHYRVKAIPSFVSSKLCRVNERLELSN